MSSFTGTVTQWDGMGFAYLGEITQMYATTVQFPNTAFRAVTNVRAKTADYIVTHLNEMVPQGFPPPADDDADSSLVNTRQLMCLPARYVPLMLDPAGYTLGQTWNILYQAIVDADDLQTCQVLVNWLRVASTSTMTQVPGLRNVVGPSTLNVTLNAPIADGVLINHRLNLLRQVLPALFRPSNPFEAAITQMAVAVTENTNDNRVAREQKAAAATAPKLPSDKFGVTLPMLLEYLNIADEGNLPDLWHKLAECTKRQEFHVICEQLQLYARSPQAFTTSLPVVSAKLAQDIINFNFVGDTLDDIKTGLQPFVIASGSAEHRQANLEIAQMYGLLTSGDHSIMLADIEQLKAKEVQSIPLSYYELERSLGMFGNLLGTVLGSTHVITQAYRDFWNLLTISFRDQTQQAIDDKRFIKPAHILRSVHLECYMWFSQRKMRQQPKTPDFAAILHSIIRHNYVVPHLPPALYRLAYPKINMPTPSFDTPSLGTASTGSTSNSGTSVVSGLTAATLASEGSSSAKRGPQGTYLANLTPDRDLQVLVDYGTKLTDLIGNDPPPMLDDGVTPICLSYYVRTGCWSNCKRAPSHGRQLTASEKLRLTTYIQNQTQKLRTRLNGASPASMVVP